MSVKKRTASKNKFAGKRWRVASHDVKEGTEIHPTLKAVVSEYEDLYSVSERIMECNSIII